MIDKLQVFFVAELINGPCCADQTSSGILLHFCFVCLLMFLICRQQTNKIYLNWQKKIGVSLEPWALFVNIFVSELSNRQYYNVSHLKLSSLFNCCPADMKKSLPQTMLTKHIIPLNACLLEIRVCL